MAETATDYEVVAVDPATGEMTWVSIGSREAAEWKAGVMPDGQHARFVEKSKAEIPSVDWTTAPVLMWGGMQTLEQSPVKGAVAKARSRDTTRRWRMVDRKTGTATRPYTLEELWERLHKRSYATLGRKYVTDDVTGGRWRAREVVQYPPETLFEWADQMQSRRRRIEAQEVSR